MQVSCRGRASWALAMKTQQLWSSSPAVLWAAWIKWNFLVWVMAFRVRLPTHAHCEPPGWCCRLNLLLLFQIPLCKVIRFNIDYTIHFIEEMMPEVRQKIASQLCLLFIPHISWKRWTWLALALASEIPLKFCGHCCKGQWDGALGTRLKFGPFFNFWVCFSLFCIYW